MVFKEKGVLQKKPGDSFICFERNCQKLHPFVEVLLQVIQKRYFFDTRYTSREPKIHQSSFG